LEFNLLPVINIDIESRINSVDVALESVGRDLDPVGQAFRQIGHEQGRVDLGAPGSV